MKKKDLFLNIIEPQFKSILEPLGYRLNVNKEIYSVKHTWGYDEIKMPILNYGVSKLISPTFCRRFNTIENIIEKFYNILHSDTPLGFTLLVGEYRLDMVSSNSKSYMIIDYDGTISQDNIDYLKSTVSNRILPFLNSMETLENLHHFINSPFDRYDDGSSNLFPLDGMTLFRKMIIAKLVDKDYEIVCDFVYSRFHNALESTKDIEKQARYNDFIQCFHLIKTYLGIVRQ